MTENNKQAATDFLQLVIAGKINEAYDKYVDMSGKHHNVFTPAGFAALRDGMKENENKFPNKHFKIHHVLGDGDLVATHSHLQLGDMDMSVVHLFRFTNGKIVELWDCGQQLPKEIINNDGAF